MADKISFNKFAEVELKVGKILSAERIEGSEKLLRLRVDLGELDAAGVSALRQILAGIGKTYAPENLIGREVVVVANLESRMMMGLESQGMLLAANSENGAVLLCPEREVLSGASVK